MSDRLSRTFAALADPTRRAILAELATGALSVNELVARHKLSQPGISKHLKVLESAGLISRGRIAQTRPCRLDPAGISVVASWLEEFARRWEISFDRMDRLLAEMKSGGGRDA
ncbi:MAG: metalloregulator ArsR/SmtB family transcription factor [Salaquimonas sp.]|jgi:DNA-binding transcriptional ArsR family regulator|nr:metalloregulator ArsR/SmtB family transcription factor [Salaquimonas sp.]